MGIFEKMSKLAVNRLVIFPTKTFPAKPTIAGTSWIKQVLKKEGHEKLILISHPEVRLRAAIAIHDRTLGRQALGGCRVLPYRNEEEMILDVLKLAKTMTSKAAMAGLELGGGKCVISYGPKTRSD